eukprot:10301374-Heterocapsa_arctica.AAC.1
MPLREDVQRVRSSLKNSRRLSGSLSQNGRRRETVGNSANVIMRGHDQTASRQGGGEGQERLARNA